MYEGQGAVTYCIANWAVREISNVSQPIRLSPKVLSLNAQARARQSVTVRKPERVTTAHDIIPA